MVDLEAPQAHPQLRAPLEQGEGLVWVLLKSLRGNAHLGHNQGRADLGLAGSLGLGSNLLLLRGVGIDAGPAMYGRKGCYMCATSHLVPRSLAGLIQHLPGTVMWST